MTIYHAVLTNASWGFDCIVQAENEDAARKALEHEFGPFGTDLHLIDLDVLKRAVITLDITSLEETT